MDLISRQAAIDALNALADYPERIAYNHGCADAVATIKALPTIDPVKRGRWVKAERDGCWTYSDAYKQCSECGKVTFLAEKMNYCPVCGARVRGEKDGC